MGFDEPQTTSLLQQAPAHHTGPFRRTPNSGGNLYVPPLPRPVLTTLRTLSESNTSPAGTNGDKPVSRYQVYSEML